MKSTLEYEIDDVIKDDKGLTIRGYVLSDTDVSFTVKDKRNGETILGEVTRYKYKNVFVDRPDAEAADEAGFIVRLPRNDCNGLQLQIESNGMGADIPIKLMHDYSKRSMATYKDALSINIMKTKKSISRRGLFGTVKKAFQKVFFPDKSYEKWLEKTALSEEEIQRQKNEVFDYEPIFSIVVPLYETPEHYLRELIVSIQDQTYSHWELCFSDGSRPGHSMREIVKRLSMGDGRIKYIDKKPGPLGISENTNQAIELATGDYIVLGDHDDLFTVDALYEVVKSINETGADVIYTDEDKTDAGTNKFFEPHFKPDFNLGFFRSNNYICHMFVVKKEIVERVGPFMDEYNGAQDFDFILRCTEVAKKIVHIPKILYHWRFHMDSTAAVPESKMYAYEAGRKAVQAHYDRLGIEATVSMGKDYGYYDTEFKIHGEPSVSIIEYDDSTDISKINADALVSDSDYLLFLHRDLVPMAKDFQKRLLSVACSEGVGAVGARIYENNGETLYHAGIVIGLFGSCGRIFSGLKDIETYHEKSRYTSDYSAVSGLCMMTDRKLFTQLGGFDESYSSSFFDVDYCLRLRKTDLRIVYEPKASFRYSKKAVKNQADEQIFIQKWKSVIDKKDRYYNPNLSLKKTDYSVE